jgi:hypothetical protein
MADAKTSPITTKEFDAFIKILRDLPAKYPKGLPRDLQEASLLKGDSGIAYTPIINDLYREVALSIDQKSYHLVFNVIWSFFEHILIELILLEESRGFLKDNPPDPDNPPENLTDTPLFKYVGERRAELENNDPSVHIGQLYDLGIIDEQECLNLRVIKKYIRLTVSHTKIKKFVADCREIGVIPKKVGMAHGEGIDTLKAVLTSQPFDETKIKKVEIDTDHEIVYTSAYNTIIQRLAPLLLFYFYDFIDSKGQYAQL